jgi:uncharacterized OB-fold protein
MTDRTFTAPVVTPETEPYFEGTKRGKLLLKHCRACGETHFYPRSFCPFCFSGDTEWQEASGDGVIYSYSVMRRAPEPFAIAYVTLAEGPTMMTNIIDTDFATLRVGLPVKLAFRDTQGGPPIPVFVPA